LLGAEVIEDMVWRNLMKNRWNLKKFTGSLVISLLVPQCYETRCGQQGLSGGVGWHVQCW